MTRYDKALYFEDYDDCIENNDGKVWLFDGLLALGEDSTWFGPPGAGKSAILLDLAINLMFLKPWRGHKTTLREEFGNIADQVPRGVIYFALERGGLTKNRIAAYKMRDPFRLPLALVTEPIDLLNPDCVDQIVATVEKYEDHAETKVGLLIFDTFSKAIANGDEDKAQTQNLAALNLAKIHERLFVHIATIGHTGKNENAGERGSNARLGHVDLAVQISEHKGKHTAEVVKANDQPQRQIASFEMEQVTVTGKRYDDSDFSYITSILAPYNPDAPETAREARTEDFRPTGRKGDALAALEALIARTGQNGFVPLDHWKDELRRVGWIKPGDKNDRVTFKRIQEALIQHLIFQGELVGIKSNGKIPPPPTLCSVAA